VFIYHFHRIIRHRIVWGVFAGGVSLLFLFTGYSYMNGKDVTAVAHIDGKPVSDETFASMEREFRGIGRNRKDSIPFPEIATQVWRQAAALQVADELKLGVSREELKTAVQESIGANEGYDSTVHANYLAELKRAGLQPAQYEEYLARARTLRKLSSVLESAAWATPVEVDDELAGLTDEMTVRTITVSNRFVNINATEAQIRAFFDAHTNDFRLSKRVAVQYVAVPVSNYLDRVSVTEEQIQEYYDDHSEKLMLTNATESLRRIEARPQILPILRRQIARQTAYTNLANAFLEIAGKGGSNGFAVAAAAFELPVRQTPFFAVDDETPAGIDAGKEFREAAFDLDASQPDGRYGVVQGENFVYAITPLANSPSPAHMPVLAEVLDRVRPLTVAKVRADSFRDYLDALHKDLATGLRERQNLVAVAQAKALNVSTSITFAVHTLTQNAFENYYPVARAALHLQPGELSEPSMTEEDAAVFVYMAARQPGDPLSAEMLRAKARANIERAHLMGLTSSWMEWNLARKGLVVAPKMASQLAVHPGAARGTED
jgi:hypothetical protein